MQQPGAEEMEVGSAPPMAEGESLPAEGLPPSAAASESHLPADPASASAGTPASPPGALPAAATQLPQHDGAGDEEYDDDDLGEALTDFLASGGSSVGPPAAAEASTKPELFVAPPLKRARASRW